MNLFVHQFLADLRSMPRALWVLVGGQFINRFGTFVNPFLALYLVKQGFSMGEVTVVLGALAVGHLAGPFAGGYFSDALGRRNTIALSLAGNALAVLGLYACDTLGQLVPVAVVYGFFAFMYGPAAHALISDLVPAAKRVMAFALLRLAINAGFAAGPAIAGLLFTRAPLLIFVGDAATTLIFAALAWLFLPHGLRTIAGRVTSPAVVLRSWSAAARDAVRNGPFVQLLAGQLLMAVAFVQAFNVLALDATARGLDPAHYGVLMGFNGFLIMLVELPLSQWVKRFAPRRVLAVGYTLVGAGCAAFAFCGSMNAFLAAMALYTLGEMLSLPVSSGYGAQLAPEQLRGRYFGLYGLVWSLASVTGSTGVWIYGHVGPKWWLWAGLFGLVAGCSMLLRVRDRRVVPPATPDAPETAAPQGTAADIPVLRPITPAVAEPGA